MFEKLKNIDLKALDFKKLSKNAVKYSLCAVVAGGIFLSPTVNAYALDPNPVPEQVVEYIDTAVFSAKLTNLLDEAVDDLKAMLVPIILTATGGGIGIGVVSVMGRVVTKKVLGMARRA